MSEAAVLDALQRADLLFCQTAHDVARLRRGGPARAQVDTTGVVVAAP